MITGRGVTLLVAAVLCWLFGRTFGISELYSVAVAAAATVGIGVLYVRQTTSSIAGRRLVDRDRVVAGSPIEVAVELRNDGRVPSPTLLVAETLPADWWASGQPEAGLARFVTGGIGPGKVAQARYGSVAHSRGRYSLGPMTIRVRDPFGVAERVRRYASTADLLVYPRIEPIGEHGVKGAHMGSGATDTRRVQATGEEFYTMREYVRGDDLRHVHWPSTAHRNKLMVRQMEQPWQAHATIYLDTRHQSHSAGRTGSLEKAVSIAASLVYYLADSGYAIRLVTDSTTGRGGPEPWEVAMDNLALLRPSENLGLGPSLGATRGGEGLFVAVLGTPPGQENLSSHPDMRALFGVRGFGQRIALVVAKGKGEPRARQAASLLVGSGWQAAAMSPEAPLIDVWQKVTHPVGRH